MSFSFSEEQDIRRKKVFILIMAVLFLLSGGWIPFVHADSTIPITTTLVTVLSNDTNQILPSICENRVVFLDNRNSRMDITYYDVLTGKEEKINDSFIANDVYPPSISNDLIVWESMNGADRFISYYNVTSGQRGILINLTGGVESSPVVEGRTVIFSEIVDTSIDLHIKEIDTGQLFVLQNGTTPTDDLNPDIYANNIIWQGIDNSGGDSDIYFWERGSLDIIDLTPNTPETFQERPKIDEHYAVWQGMDIVNSTYDIYLCNLSSRETQLLTPSTPFSNEMNPVVSGDRVAWERMNETTYQSEIVLYTISTKELILLSPGTHGEQYNPSIWGNRVVWTENDPSSWTFDIFMATCDILANPLVPSLTVNITFGGTPLLVQFQDTSLGNPSAWLWDFGDGETSNEQHPLHTFTKPGTYSVTLIVNTQYRREGIKAENMITVGSAPVSNFSVDHFNGAAPLLVHFSDLSSGFPVNWSWDFGDGIISEEKNPMHVYSSPGVYNVTLTVWNDFGLDSLEKLEYIEVIQGQTLDMTFPSEGITLNEQGGFQSITLNNSVLGGILSGNDTIYTFKPTTIHNFSSISLFSPAGMSFFPISQDVLQGNIAFIDVKSDECTDPSYSQNWTLFSLFHMDSYPQNGKIKLTAWPGATEGQYQEFRKIAMQGNISDPNWTLNVYGDVESVAFTAQFECENISGPSPVVLVFGLDSEWIEKFGWRRSVLVNSTPAGAFVYVNGDSIGTTPIVLPSDLSAGTHNITVIKKNYDEEIQNVTLGDKRDSIRVIRLIGDGSGEILTTEFLYHDPENNLDYFRAESPHGFSTFGVVSTSDAGNPIQIIFLTLQELIPKLLGKSSGGGNTQSVEKENPATTIPTTIPLGTNLPTPIPTLTQISIPNQPPETGITVVTTTHTNPAIPPVQTNQNVVPPIPFTLIQTIAIFFGAILVISVLVLRMQKGGGGS